MFSEDYGNAASPSSFIMELQDAVTTEEDSLTFMSQMAYISTAQVLLFRRVIPCEAVKQLSHLGFPYFVFNQDHPWGLKLHYMMLSMSSAITKKLLKETRIMLMNGDETSNDTLEVFTLQFAYGRGEAMQLLDVTGAPIVQTRYCGKEAFKNQIEAFTSQPLLDLTRALSLLKPLPAKVSPQMQMSLYKHDLEKMLDFDCGGFQQTPDPLGMDDRKILAVARVDTEFTAMLAQLSSVCMKGNMEQLIQQKMDEWECCAEEASRVIEESDGEGGEDEALYDEEIEGAEAYQPEMEGVDADEGHPLQVNDENEPEDEGNETASMVGQALLEDIDLGVEMADIDTKTELAEDVNSFVTNELDEHLPSRISSKTDELSSAKKINSGGHLQSTPKLSAGDASPVPRTKYGRRSIEQFSQDASPVPPMQYGRRSIHSPSSDASPIPPTKYGRRSILPDD